MKYLPLSIFPPLIELPTKAAVDKIVELGYDGIINDIMPMPHVEYSVEDLLNEDLDIWTDIQIKILVDAG